LPPPSRWRHLDAKCRAGKPFQGLGTTPVFDLTVPQGVPHGERVLVPGVFLSFSPGARRRGGAVAERPAVPRTRGPGKTTHACVLGRDPEGTRDAADQGYTAATELPRRRLPCPGRSRRVRGLAQSARCVIPEFRRASLPVVPCPAGSPRDRLLPAISPRAQGGAGGFMLARFRKSTSGMLDCHSPKETSLWIGEPGCTEPSRRVRFRNVRCRLRGCGSLKSMPRRRRVATAAREPSSPRDIAVRRRRTRTFLSSLSRASGPQPHLVLG
jgi:hypothetical protein